MAHVRFVRVLAPLRILVTAAYVIAFVVMPVFTAPQPVQADTCPDNLTPLQANIQTVMQQDYDLRTKIENSLRPLQGGISQDDATNLSDRLDTATARLEGLEQNLRQYAENHCQPESVFESNKKFLLDKVNLLDTDLIPFYNDTVYPKTPASWALAKKALYTDQKAHPGALINPEYSVDQTCAKLITQADQRMTAAEKAMDSADRAVADWESRIATADQSFLEAANQSLDAANTQFTAVRAEFTVHDPPVAGTGQLKAAGCDTGATAAAYAGLKGRLDALQTRGQRLQDTLGKDSSSVRNWVDTGLINAAVQVDSCGCGDLTKNDGIINGIFDRAICLTVCTISSALGVIACYIIGALIDPVFGTPTDPKTGKPVKTCDPNPDANQPSSSPSTPSPGTASTPKTSASSPPAATKPNPNGGGVDTTPVPGAPAATQAA